MRKNGVKGKPEEPHWPNQNPAEGIMRELKRKWYKLMFETNIPRRLWCYGLKHVAKIMQVTASNSRSLNGRIPLEVLMGETPDISE